MRLSLAIAFVLCGLCHARMGRPQQGAGADEEYIAEHLPATDAEFAADPHGYNADRDMLGFSDDEADGNAELHQKFNAHFDLVDSNNDGYLEHSELDARLRKAMLQRIQDRNATMMKASTKEHSSLDKNGDGMLDNAEYMAHWAPANTADHTSEEQKRLSDEIAKEAEQYQQGKFRLADENTDGTLTAAEYLIIYAPHVSPRREVSPTSSHPLPFLTGCTHSCRHT